MITFSNNHGSIKSFFDFSQGRYELKHGDARRALFYFNRANEAGMKVNLLFVLRSEANCILGKVSWTFLD